MAADAPNRLETSRGAQLASALAHGRRHLQAHLVEMPVRRDDLCQLQFTYQRDARAVGERQLLVAQY